MINPTRQKPQVSGDGQEAAMSTTAPNATLLPDPSPREVKNLLISTDDHIVEPPDMFDGRLPEKFAEKGPRVIDQDGVQAWLLEDLVLPNMGLNAVAGRPREEWYDEPRT